MKDAPASEGEADAQWARTQEQRRQNAEECSRTVIPVAKSLITAGFQSLAEKPHPDKDDGSNDAMALVRLARELLEKMLSEASWSDFDSFIRFRGK